MSKKDCSKCDKFMRALGVLFGLFLLVVPANALFSFLPAPEFNEAAGVFVGALFNAGFIFPFMNVALAIAGLLFIVGKAKPFATLLLLPFTVNMALFHLVIDPNNASFAYVYFLLNLVMVWDNRKALMMLFK